MNDRSIESTIEERQMANTTAPQSIQELLKDFAPCFTKPGFKNFATLITGWITCQGRHSISRVIQAGSNFAEMKHHSCFYRFLSQGSWSTDAIGRILFQLLLPFL
ncbi:MAG TPA: hypothetical protein EYP31_04985, partial [Roseibacterium sp.]|nr:hypothetical protein [Roseibacterium sp.]